MLYRGWDDPDYNIMVRTAPVNVVDAPGDAESEPIDEW